VNARVTAAPPVVAAFDVDGTLTRRDSIGPFLLRVAGLRLPLAFARRPGALVTGLLHRDHDRLKELVCSSLAGVDEGGVRAAGAAYGRELYEHRLRADTPARLRRHHELGHRVVLVSASLEPYLLPLGALLGVDAVLCTRLETDSEGRFTGRLDGRNCRGPEKARRLDAWLQETGLERAEIWAYGDSSGDDALLAMSDHPVRVRGTHVSPEPVA
jgi:phosphatidylglycerophosphatase C